MINLINIKPQSNLNFKGLIKKRYQNNINKKQENTNLINSNGINSRVEIELESIKDNEDFNRFLNRKGKVTLEEYLEIKQKHPEILLKAIKRVEKISKDKGLLVTPKLSAQIISILNEFLSGNIKIISIGTSPSFITEAMKATGKDVTFLPLSSGGMCDAKYTIRDYFEYYPNFKLAGEYLKYQGITPEKLKGKDVIILDYCATGRTLHLVKRLVNEYCEIDKDNIFAVDLMLLIKSYCETEEEKSALSYDDIQNVGINLMYQEIETASNVPHFSIYSDRRNMEKAYTVSSRGKSKEELFREFDDFSRPSARAYQLCVLNELDLAGVIQNQGKSK